MTKFNPTIHTKPYLDNMINKHGAKTTADKLDISYMSLTRWLKKAITPEVKIKPKNTQVKKRKKQAKIPIYPDLIKFCKTRPDVPYTDVMLDRAIGNKKRDRSLIKALLSIMRVMNNENYDVKDANQ